MMLETCLLPYIDIGITFYCGVNTERKKCLQNLQTKCLKTVHGKKNSLGKDDAHRVNRILTSKIRQILHLLKYAHIYKIKE